MTDATKKVTWAWDGDMRLSVTTPDGAVMVLDHANMPDATRLRAIQRGYMEIHQNAVAGDGKAGNWTAYRDTLRATHTALRFGLDRRTPASNDIPDTLAAIAVVRAANGLGRADMDSVNADAIARGVDWITKMAANPEIKLAMTKIRYERAMAVRDAHAESAGATDGGDSLAWLS